MASAVKDGIATPNAVQAQGILLGKPNRVPVVAVLIANEALGICALDRACCSS